MAFGSIAPGMDDEDALLELQSGGLGVPAGAFGPVPAVSQPPSPPDAPVSRPQTPATDIDWSRLNQPLGELKPPPPRLPSQWAGDVVGDPAKEALTRAGMDPYYARQLVGGVGGIIGGLTPVGIGLSAADAVAAKARGNNPALVTAMAGLVPGVRAEESVAKELVGDAARAPDWHGALEGTGGAQNIQPTGVGVSAGERALPAGSPATAVPTGSDVAGGAGGGDARLPAAQASAERAAGRYAPLPGLPQKAIDIGGNLYVPGPIGKIKDVAEQYMRGKLLPTMHQPPEQYYPLDKEHSRNIAQAFEDMPHAPDDPAVKNSYDAMIKETRDQYRAIRQYHPELQIEPITPEMGDPYASNPRAAAMDVRDNNHLYFFPTEQGYGTGEQAGIDMSKHPMMQPSGETLNGKPLLNNDLFRVVHDYFGHLKEGYGFRAEGEDNAWRSHAAMYSDLARPAMTSETRGQNSWVNYGPHGEANRKASGADTVYADQKAGLMPEWTMRDRGSPAPMITYRGGAAPYSMVDMSKIGTGEGSGVRGEGMYSAEAPPVATFYRHYTATVQDPLLKKYKLGSFEANNMGRDLGHTGGDHGPIVEDLNDHISNLKAQQAEGDTSAAVRNQIKTSQAMIRYLNDPNRATGHMYELALDRPDEQYLHWDRPLSEQSQYVRDKFQPIIDARTPEIQRARAQLLAKAQERLARNPPGILQQKLQADIDKYSQPVNWEDTPGSKLYVAAAHHALGRPPANPDEAYPIASQYLRAKGIAGIKYYAGQNFNLPRGVPPSSHNYVSFNPERILKRYAIPGAIGTGLGASMMSRGQEDGT